MASFVEKRPFRSPPIPVIGGRNGSNGGYRPLPAVETRVHDGTMIDVYESAVEGTGRFGAVFERDDDTAYLYLLDMTKEEAGQIIAAVSVDAITEMAADVPISIRWNGSASAAGLFVSGNLLALFDLRESGPIGRFASAEDWSLFPSR